MNCNRKTEVYSRVVGFLRPVQVWNLGKKAEFQDRKTFKQEKINAKEKTDRNA